MALHRQEYLQCFKTLRSMGLPRPFSILSKLLLISFVLITCFLVFVPWVQTSNGNGQITALYPEDRVQTINALTAGRIGKWYVADGAKVKKGDPIVDIVDNDPDFFSRLESERDAIAAKLAAAQRAAETSAINYRRQKELHAKGLSSKRDYEQASIALEGYKADVESAKAELNKAEVQLSRQNTQLVVAPKDGTVLNINAGDIATFVDKGAPLATFFPDRVKPAVELYVSGLDAPLIYKGREVQLIFEGWPAVQFSGWPSVARGTFKGEVFFVDPAMSQNGRIRILVVPSDDETWPSAHFLRFGTRARGWVLLDTVSVGFEIWRQMNNFPPKYSAQNTENMKAEKAKM